VSQTASQRPKTVLVVLLVLVVIGVLAFAGWRLVSGDDDPAGRQATGAGSTSATEPTGTPTSEPTTTPTTTPTCEGPDTQFNVEGVEQDSLLPDCGTSPVSRAQERKAGLGLACGGSYPVILYKTTTSGAKTSICGKDATGESFRFVIKPRGGEVLDLRGRYEYEIDSFVAKKDGTTYIVQAYNGTLLVKKDGSTSAQKSTDWISLDNESDYD
jgi:hypothetical protein